ncbi:MAG: hypothetical protein Q8N98_03140 [bacterium]|nr:hypothetical protein [bacterium]
MNGLTTITTKGQVTIPEEIRMMLGARVGDRVAFEVVSAEKKQAAFSLIPRNIAEALYGSLETKVKFKNHEQERKLLRRELLKRYLGK